MRTLLKRDYPAPPKVSVILLDWSCRESFHSLHYLNKQSVPRDSYELLWVEYYNREAPQIQEQVDARKQDGGAPPIDQWILLDVPDEVYYHKHVMYNAGIEAARGEIVVICDSDAVFTENFIKTIIDAFPPEGGIVLHLDQVRNYHKTFYPFNFPSIGQITGPGAVNFKDGKTTGLLDTKDPLHKRNYGACFAALRSDLIAIGGADEDDTYLGHICGPYEMTFRLRNAGKREIWHQSELLYHVWHPGQAGAQNYFGPHDGKHMSATALAVIQSKRVMPLVENPVIKGLREGTADPDTSLVPTASFARWKAMVGGVKVPVA